MKKTLMASFSLCTVVATSAVHALNMPVPHPENRPDFVAHACNTAANFISSNPSNEGRIRAYNECRPKIRALGGVNLSAATKNCELFARVSFQAASPQKKHDVYMNCMEGGPESGVWIAQSIEYKTPS